jgi:hypothetical protein
MGNKGYFMGIQLNFMGIEGRFMEIEGHFIGTEEHFIWIEGHNDWTTFSSFPFSFVCIRFATEGISDGRVRVRMISQA